MVLYNVQCKIHHSPRLTLDHGWLHAFLHGDLLLSSSYLGSFLHDAAVARGHSVEPLKNNAAGDFQLDKQEAGEG